MIELILAAGGPHCPPQATVLCSLNHPAHPFFYAVRGLQGLCLGHATVIHFQMREEVTVILLSKRLNDPPPQIPLASFGPQIQ